jgi:hypothetical protein
MLGLVFAGVVLSGFAYQTLMPGYLVNVLDHPSSHLGLIFSMAAIGGIIVNLGLATWPPKNSIALMLFFGSGLALSLALLAVAPGFGAALAVSALLGASSSGFQMLNNVNLMERTDGAYLGRVMALTMMAFGVNSIAAYPVGLIADSIGERTTLAGLSCACFGVIALGVMALRSTSGREHLGARQSEPVTSSGG